MEADVIRRSTLLRKGIVHTISALLLPMGAGFAFAQAPSSECPRGTSRTPQGCVAVKIPENAEIDVYGHGWTCKRGFRDAGGTCVAVRIPENAEVDVYGHGWQLFQST
jgi:hypothetical protein